MEQESWRNLSEKILIDVKEWRRAHPKATFVEIEDEIHQRMMQLEAHLLQEAAEASASREWGKASSPEDRPQCPNCAVARPRARETEAHPARKWRRKCHANQNLWNLPQMWGEFFSPLDKELALLPGNLAPRQHEHLVHLASWMPFAQASSLLTLLLGVQAGKETVRRLTEQAGEPVEQAQTQAAKAEWQEKTTQIAPPARLVMSADGAYVPLVKGEWAEVRTLAIGQVKTSRASGKKSETRAQNLSSFSRMTSAERFSELAEVETRRRQVVQAEQVCAVMDGAGWLQGLVDVHRPDALRILDFPHAAEHLSLLLQTLEQAGISLSADLLPRLLHHLKHRGPRALLRLAKRLPAHLSEVEGVREHLSYLQKREALMDYPEFRKHGWPIGSGSVESANKLVVQARLKGAGMHWERKNVNPMPGCRAMAFVMIAGRKCGKLGNTTWGSSNNSTERRVRNFAEREPLPCLILSCSPLPLCLPNRQSSRQPLPFLLLHLPLLRLCLVLLVLLLIIAFQRGPACSPPRFAKM
jgi:hypothetical protein